MVLVQASDCSAYDCEFVALVRALAIPLITADTKILKAFPDTACAIGEFLSRH